MATGDAVGAGAGAGVGVVVVVVTVVVAGRGAGGAAAVSCIRGTHWTCATVGHRHMHSSSAENHGAHINSITLPREC